MGTGVGTLELASGFVGSKELQSIWVGSTKVWSKSVDELALFLQGDYTSYENSVVTSLAAGKVIGIAPYGVFGECSNLTYVSLPNLTTLNSISLAGNGLLGGALAEVNIPRATSIHVNSFYGQSNLTTVHLGTYTGTVCTLVVDGGAYDTLPSNLKFYVPSSMLAAYQADSVWANYTSYLVGE